MLCLECSRCGRRSLVDERLTAKIEEVAKDALALSAPGRMPAPPEAGLRCDLCGSHRIYIHNFASRYEALHFAVGKGS